MSADSPIDSGSVIVSKESGEKYTLSRCLSQAGFRSVWLCTTSSGKTCAAKVEPSPNDLDKEMAVQREYAEFSEFINIPKLHEACHGSFRNESFLFLAMDFIDGVSFQRFLEKVAVAEFAAKSVLCDAGRALAFLHSKGIAHGDVKAGSVMLAKDGKAFLCDAGVVWAADGSERRRLPIAPELFEMGGRPDMARVDVWFFGLVALEALLQGERRAKFDDTMLMRHTPECAPANFRLVDYSEDYASVVASCLTKDPAKRPPMRDLLSVNCLDLKFPHMNRNMLRNVLNHPDNLALLSEQ